MGRLGECSPCLVEGCGYHAHARFLCITHYARWQRLGSPLPVDYNAIRRMRHRDTGEFLDDDLRMTVVERV